MAGYSTTPLQQKLGIKEGMYVYILNAPANYFDLISPLREQVKIAAKHPVELDFIHLFVKEMKSLRKEFNLSKKKLKKDGMIWVSWPKKASKVFTDLDENAIREVGLAEGMVDVKVCAVDDTWSGLKFIFRLKDRP